MWSDLPSPVVIAHRGDSACAPENTLAAFRMAAEKGADAIEFDAKLSADGRVIVIHDQTVSRTTNGQGEVRKLKYAEMRSLDAGVWFGERFIGERIPTLDEIFETVGKSLHINVELTNYAAPTDDLVVKVVETIRRHGNQEQILFSSFLPRNLRKAAGLLPRVPRALLAWSNWLGWPARELVWQTNTYWALNPHFVNADLRLVNRVHARGKRVNVWTVNDVTEMKRLIGLGVDGIFTDDPAKLLGLLGRTT